MMLHEWFDHYELHTLASRCDLLDKENVSV